MRVNAENLQGQLDYTGYPASYTYNIILLQTCYPYIVQLIIGFSYTFLHLNVLPTENISDLICDKNSHFSHRIDHRDRLKTSISLMSLTVRVLKICPTGWYRLEKYRIVVPYSTVAVPRSFSSLDDNISLTS